MKDFELFIQNGDVKKQASDKNLSDSLEADSIKRMEYTKSSKISEDDAKYIYENVYESLREAADAILILQGFKSFSHEASISFLQRFNDFSAAEIAEFNRLRIKRNGMKYYGKSCSTTDVEEAIKFAERLLKKIISIRKNLQKPH